MYKLDLERIKNNGTKIIKKFEEDEKLTLEEKLDFIFMIFSIFDEDEVFISSLIEAINEKAGYDETDMQLKDFIEGLQYLDENTIDDIIYEINLFLLAREIVKGFDNEN